MSKAAIRFYYQNVSFTFPHRGRVKELLLFILKKERIPTEAINYIFCTDEALLSINQQYLKHHTYTDIITFQLTYPPEPVLSDIFVSIERIKDNAQKFSVPFYHELLRVMIHGVLHLCGYKDKTSKDKEVMRRKENHYLEFFLKQNGSITKQ